MVVLIFHVCVYPLISGNGFDIYLICMNGNRRAVAICPDEVTIEYSNIVVALAGNMDSFADKIVRDFIITKIIQSPRCMVSARFRAA